MNTTATLNRRVAVTAVRARPVASKAYRPAQSAGLIRRIFCRPEPSMYQRFLAVHMYFAKRASALD